MENLTALYRAIKKEYANVQNLDRLFCDHPDHDQLVRLRALTLADLAMCYWSAGGKRDVVRYLRPWKGIIVEGRRGNGEG